MLHVVTVHFQSDAWIEPQLRYLRRFTPPGTQIWASLDGIEHGRGFDHETSLIGTHPEKLNEMARIVSSVARPDDHLLFLDGDAFPVAPLGPLLDATDKLTAVRCDENFNDLQPHPCFAFTTVRLWNEIAGDWSPGYVSDRGAIDVGGELLRVLKERGLAWRPLTRLNTVDLNPLWFGVYGDEQVGPVVYHHWAAFRARVARVHRVPKPAIIPAGVRLLGRAERSLRWRWRQNAIYVRRLERSGAKQEQQVRGWIADDDNIVTRFVR